MYILQQSLNNLYMFTKVLENNVSYLKKIFQSLK